MKENWVYRRGDIYLANLGVPIGSKQGGVRPVVVLQNDVGNFYSPTITVAPLTTKIQKKRSQPTHYFLRKAKGLARSSMVLAEQLDTCDKTCVIRYLGKVIVSVKIIFSISSTLSSLQITVSSQAGRFFFMKMGA